jgi:hypothetical protein
MKTTRGTIGAVVLISLLAQLGGGVTAAQRGVFMSFGPAKDSESCGSWVKASGTEHEIDRWWLFGFVTGASHVLSASDIHLADTDFRAIEAWVMKYCTDNPLDPSMHAAVLLVAELKKRGAQQ